MESYNRCFYKRTEMAVFKVESKLFKTVVTHLRNIRNLTTKSEVSIVEVGPRDGLQNEKKIISTATKVKLIERLADCGFSTVEATSFVSPKWIPQMADHSEVMSSLKRRDGVSYPVLVPNMEGLEKVLQNKAVKEIAVFASASETFSRKNTNCSVEVAATRLRNVTLKALEAGLAVRGYISCVIGCPYDGAIQPSAVGNIAEQLLSAGCYEISLGDTIGVGSAGSVRKLLDYLLTYIPAKFFAVHFHDTYGQALSNVLVAFDKGIQTADGSVAGLGGCPYANGATGNLATEDLIYMLHDLGCSTGVNLDSVVEVSEWICRELGKVNCSRVTSALLSKRRQ
ncbi:hypothetical protein AB6A40_006680 [Gnathostoma spinigerum]|uniref:hydroxymethylglutaryl-CoA lyase n=1 Tax=Gnathostoma spinigerum TaxID=75299 RepID=A0ABD6EJN9_9BILA